MAFGGLAYCATLPGPRERAGALEYYVQALDDLYQSQRTSTHVLPVQPEGQAADELGTASSHSSGCPVS